MPNPFAHIELSTDDLKKAKKFYQGVFAWKLSEMPAMAYTMIDVGGGVGGGMQKKQMPEQPTTWLPYVQVDDVEFTMAKVVKAGGTAMLAYQEIGDMGAIGIFQDPQGATLGLWAPKAASEAPTPTAKTASKKAPTPEPAPAPTKKAALAPPAPAKKTALAPPAPAKKAAAKKGAAPAAPPAPAKKAAAKKGAAPPAKQGAPKKR